MENSKKHSEDTVEERLQKILSAAGVCSRRKAEEYIQQKRVTVGGRVAALGERADPEREEIALDGVAVTAVSPLYLMLHKPRGYVTTLSDEKGRPTVAELVRDCGQRVYPVGRLDMDSEGLLLLTSDGAFANRLAHPSHAIEKEYYVTVSGASEDSLQHLAALRQLEDGTPISAAKVRLVKSGESAWVISVTIHQGLNRQVRRMCQAVGLRVHRLRRIREGSLTLGSLPSGRWRRLTEEEIRRLGE